MIGSLKTKVNVFLLALVATICISGIQVINSQVAHARLIPRSPVSWMDDNCYSTTSVGSTLGQNFGGIIGDRNIIGKYGLVNAVVRVPIYDWDQNPPMPFELNLGNPIPISLGVDSHTVSFTAPSVRPVGYLEYFSATITPVPNIQWMQEYATKQAPYDLSRIAMLAGGGSNVREPNPFIANPLLYSRASVIKPNGMPNLSFSNPGFENRSGEGAVDDDSGLSAGDFYNLDGAYSFSNGEIIANEVGSEAIGNIRDNPGGYNSGTVGGDLSGLGITGTRFSVNKNNPGDNCREYLNDNAPLVPSYAFSVPGVVGFPFTFPGTLISPITMLAGRGVSSSGITSYQASANGKMMLDCYGRGIQPTIVPTNQTITQGGSFWFIIRIPNFDWTGLLYLAATAIDTAITGNPMTEVIRRLPMPKIVNENYFNGLAYLFNVDRPIQRDLPVHLRDRDIDFGKSKLTSVNAQVLMARNGSHSDSNNGTTYYPNLYLKLKKPYKHTPVFSSSEQKLPDGTMLNVQPQLQKDGYRSSPRYSDGGNRNEPPLENSARARVVEVILKPGQYGQEIRSEDFTGSELGTTNGIDPNQLCGFIRDRLGDSEAECDASRPEFGGETGINITDLPGVEGEDRLNAFNAIASNGGLITRKITAETEPGTKFCYAVYLSKQDNDIKFSEVNYYRHAGNYNPNYGARTDKRYLSRAHCVISGYKPSFQVRGGDLIAGGSVDTEVNTKEYLANPNTLRTYGSWVEYGAISGGPIKHLASGAGYRVGMPAGANPNVPEGTPSSDTEAEDRENVGPLSFSNNRSSDGSAEHGNFGEEVNDGFSNIVTQFVELAGTGSEVESSEVNVSELPSGVHVLRPNTTLTSSGQIQPERSVVLLAPNDSTVYIDSNIELQDSYPDESQLSQVVIAPLTPDAKFNINIRPGVSRVDSWLINPNGKLNTCFINDDPEVSDSQTPRGFDWPCYNTLTVNGPVSAHTLLLRRSGSRDQNEQPPYELRQSVAGENFNLRPDAYIWAANYVSDFGRKLVTTNLLDLPPRF